MRHVKAKEDRMNDLLDRVLSLMTAGVILGVVLAAMGLKPAEAAADRQPAIEAICTTDADCMLQTGISF